MMSGENHDIPSLPELAATVRQHGETIAQHADRIKKLESNNEGIETHLGEQDQKLETLPEIKLAIIGDGGEVNVGMVRKVDGLKHDFKTMKASLGGWTKAMWLILGGLAYAVAAYVIHR
jgi:hypothetical protein